jgi:NDP-sugar pyrophosphorylase family protein
MKALIFAAGRGIRMMPLTDDRPKPLLELMGKPLLTRIIESLPAEITELVLVVGYKGEMIRSYFGGETEGRKITYIEQKEQLGTGDALMSCRALIGEGERFLVLYADDMHDSEALARAVDGERLAIFVARVQYPERFGIVVTDATGRVTGLEEAPKKPKTDMAVTGAYILDSDIFGYPPAREPNGEYYINSMLIPYMKEREVFAEVESFWLPIGYPEDIQKAEEAMRSRAS